VILEGGQPLEGQPAAQATAQIVSYQPNALEIDVDIDLDVGTEPVGYLFLSDPFYPGWRAEVDGQPATILQANYAFRAVPVPAGTHRVTMAFRPGSWYAGLGITAFTLLLLLILGGLALARHQRRNSHL
jgi:uncharacterized membrane protein YfhO